jgi:DNA-binding transcriptional LysR family regulator
LLPDLLPYLGRVAPGVRLRIVAPDADGLEASLETGQLDFAMGSFTALSKRIRRQSLWPVTYVSVVRHGHPRLGSRPSAAAFAAERHVVVSTVGTGHAHQQAERALERAIPAENILCRVPTFMSAAFAAGRTDVVATVPSTVAAELCELFGLREFPTPLRMPRLDVSQYWHERFHRDPGNQWIRSVFASLFAASASR